MKNLTENGKRILAEAATPRGHYASGRYGSTNSLRPLLKHGLIYKTFRSTSERAWIYRITDEGKRVLGELQP